MSDEREFRKDLKMPFRKQPHLGREWHYRGHRRKPFGALNLILILCIFGPAGSSLLHGLFSSCSQWGPLSRFGAWAPHHAGFSWRGARAVGRTVFSCCSEWAQWLRLPGSRAEAQKLWCTGLVAPQHVGSSRIRDQTHVSRIGRWILYH